MAEEPELSEVRVQDWRGMATNVDPHSLAPGGTQLQINCCSMRAGELQARKGLRLVEFD